MKKEGLTQIRSAQRSGSDRIVAVSLLTEDELRNVRTSLRHIYPVPADGSFDDLLQAIGRAKAYR